MNDKEVELIWCRGLPGSGKSTWARECQSEIGSDKVKIVDKDSIRKMLDQSVWSKANEKFTLKVRDFIITEALKDGYTVIVHDTNLADFHVERFKEIAAANGAKLVKQDFTHVPLETCIANDLKRFDSVGEKVIREMHKKYLAVNRPAKDKEPVYVEHLPGLPSVVVVDLDGTLALMGNRRSPYDFTKVHLDTVHAPVKAVIDALLLSGVVEEVIFCSGRSDECRVETEDWLEQAGFFAPKLFMRKKGDYRKDTIVKREITENEIFGNYNIVVWLDDRTMVVDEIRGLGIPVFQVAPGNF